MIAVPCFILLIVLQGFIFLYHSHVAYCPRRLVYTTYVAGINFFLLVFLLTSPKIPTYLMGKQLCACGCGDRVTRKVEVQHMNGIGPALLVSQVLAQNRSLIHHKKTPLLSARRPAKSKAIGLSGSVRRRFSQPNNAHGNISEDQDVDMDQAGPSNYTTNPLSLDPPMMVDDQPGTSFNIPSSPIQPQVHEDNEVYGLSTLRRSGRITKHVEQIGQQRWGLKNIVLFVNDREESSEEEPDTEDDECASDSYVDTDEDMEGDGELIAGHGLEGISLWDTLGEGFLKEAAQLGMLFSYF